VSGGLLAAGGFTGELVLAQLSRTDEEAWDDDDDDDDDCEDDEEDDYEHEAAAAAEISDDIMQEDGLGKGQASAEAAVAGDAAATFYRNVQQHSCGSCSWAAMPSVPAGPAQRAHAARPRQLQQQQQQAGHCLSRPISLEGYLQDVQQQQPGVKQQDLSWHRKWQQQQQLRLWQQHWQPWRQQQWRQQQHRGQQQGQSWPLPALHHRQQQQQQQQQPAGRDVVLGAAGPAAAEVLHCCRVTQSENGITNGIEICNSCKGPGTACQ
jgi:hypothetical protein